MRDDHALLEAWGGGDKAAGAELFDRHFRAVARFFRNKVSEEADDLIQNTFLAVLHGRDRFRGEGSFRAFLFGVANNVLRNHFRTRRRDDARVDFSVSSIHELAPRPSELLVRRAEHRLLLEGLRRIPLDHQVLLELYFWEGLPASTIGDALGVPEGTVRTRLRRARQLLAEAIVALEGAGRPVTTTLTQLDDWAEQVRELIDLGREA